VPGGASDRAGIEIDIEVALADAVLGDHAVGHRGEDIHVALGQLSSERLIGATFGRNYGEVYDLLDKQWNLSQEMKDAVDLRNELAHRWMLDRPNGLDTQESRQAMIAELEAANAQLQHMTGVLAERIQGFMRSVGVNQDEILAELRRLTES
jgi:hypothetical protein